MPRFWNVTLVGVAALVVLTTCARIPVFWGNEAYLDMPSGVWFGLAKDLLDGVFYRPVIGPEGFGGTRYLPVQFVLHAGISRLLGGELMWAARVISGGFGLGLLAAAYVLLRRLGATRAVAGGCAGLIFAAQPAQFALLSFRGDLVSATFSLWGVAMCAGPAIGTTGLVLAGALFALAAGAKATTLFGMAGAVAFLWLSGRRRAAWILLGSTAAFTGLWILAMILASDGRAVDAWRVGASSGIDVSRLIRSPFQFARKTREVPETLAFIQLAIAGLLALNAPRPQRAHLPSLLFLATLTVTTVIFAFDGAGTNHLLDLQVASVVLLGSWIVSAQPHAQAFGAAALAVAGLAASLSLVNGLVEADTQATRGAVRETVALLSERERPILAENPLVAVAAGQRPYMLDSYLFAIIRTRHPEWAERLWSDLASQRFGAVVLERDPHSDRGRPRYAQHFFGEGFVERLEQSYEEAGRIRERVVYRPKRR